MSGQRENSGRELPLQPFEPEPMLPAKTQIFQLLRRFWFDWLMAIALVIVNRPLENNLTPFKRVFRIDDPTISYPWSPDTVPKEAIFIFMIVIPTLVILTISGFLKPHVFDAHNALLGMFAAAAMSGLATDLLKSGVGRLRPDFLARCMVNPKYYNGTIPPGPGGFVDESVCTTTDVQSLLNGRQSFPSGHTSGCFVGMAYTSLYLLSHLPTLLPFHRISLHLPNIFFGFLPISLALWVGITRIEDYRHNPTDVMGGAIVGCFFAAVGWIAFGRRGAKAWRRSLGDFGDREGRDYVEEPEPGYERVVGDPAAV